MKKIFNSILCLLLLLTNMTGCKVEEGEYPGNDSNPSVVLYQYKPDAEQYNVDNDLVLRIAQNSAVKEVYYLSQKKEEKEAKVNELGEEGYMSFVVKNGTKLDNSDSQNIDVIITGLKGENVITVVGVNGDKMVSAQTSFMGIDWVNIGNGIYTSVVLNQQIPTPVLKAQHAEWYKLPGFSDLIIKVDASQNATVVTTPLFDHPNYGKVYGNTIDGEPAGGVKEGSVIYLNMYYFVPGLGSFGTFLDTLQLPN